MFFIVRVPRPHEFTGYSKPMVTELSSPIRVRISAVRSKGMFFFIEFYFARNSNSKRFIKISFSLGLLCIGRGHSVRFRVSSAETASFATCETANTAAFSAGTCSPSTCSASETERFAGPLRTEQRHEH